MVGMDAKAFGRLAVEASGGVLGLGILSPIVGGFFEVLNTPIPLLSTLTSPFTGAAIIGVAAGIWVGAYLVEQIPALRR